jgi:acyl carrier protein
MVDRATLEDAVQNGIDLSSNAFMLIHGWTCGPLLLEFVAHFLKPLSKRPMTLQELAQDTDAKVGPLAITLRTCCILGYVDFHSEKNLYSVNPSSELTELDTYLRPTSSTAKALQSIYSEAIPPFKVPSEAATHCLVTWTEQRPSWATSSSKALRILLDGIVLAPLLTSITYFARWNEDGLDLGKDKVTEKFDFSKVDAISRRTLGDILEELGVGVMNPKGVVSLSSKGSLALQRCYSYYVPTSYSPMLDQFHTILFEDPGWGFVDAGQDAEETEIHVERTLNVVGSGAQHQTLFKDLMRHINIVFAGEDFQNQPQFVVDTGSGDGHLLMHIYEHVKEHTPRGRALKEFPLTMVGVDFNEESRVATAVNLSKRKIPHIVIFGDIGKPAAIMKALQKKHVDLAKTLHVRSFLDHDRPYIAPKNKLAEDSVTAAFARSQMVDFVHLDKHGNPITPLEVFASLVEHFGRWGDALEGSFGLCMLEVMMLDIPTTKRFFNDCVSFHFDIVQCLSRQYMISPVAFAMGAALAGLLPTNVKNVQTYPEQGKYCRVINQHLVRRPFKIRFAELSDLPSLERIERLAWAEPLQGSSDVLRKRLQTSPTSNFVCEMGDKVVGVLYTQRVASIDSVGKHRFMDLSSAHSPNGSIIQLIAVATDPQVSNLSIGSDLRSFALHLARLDPTVDSVIGVTRCRDFKGYNGSMQEYVNSHVSGAIVDPILDFHTSFGAQVVHLVHNFRPEDADNDGTGVLIQYKVKELGSIKAGQTEAIEEQSSVVPTLDILAHIMSELGYPLDHDDLNKGFFDYGMDSLELVRVRNKLSSTLAMELPATLLLDFPTVKDLADQLDRDRGVGGVAAETASQQADALEEIGHDSFGWETVTPSELLEIHEKCKKAYKQHIYQKKFQEIARKCYPDMMKYVLAVESVLVEVEGPILLEFGLIDALDWKTVQKGRGQLTTVQMKYWTDFPEVRSTLEEIMHLTKQDQYWQ